MLKIYQLRLKQNSFEVTLKYKGVGVRVVFADGNTYNDIPAKCYTNDPFKQRAIEASQMFKDKDIVLERSVPEASDNKPTPSPGQQNPPVDTGLAPEPTVDDGLKAMTFYNLGEAIQYVAQTWQVPVQTEADARRVLKEHGINPRIKKG